VGLWYSTKLRFLDSFEKSILEKILQPMLERKQTQFLKEITITDLTAAAAEVLYSTEI
jgi:hypothetical protein